MYNHGMKTKMTLLRNCKTTLNCQFWDSVLRDQAIIARYASFHGTAELGTEGCEVWGDMRDVADAPDGAAPSTSVYWMFPPGPGAFQNRQGSQMAIVCCPAVTLYPPCLFQPGVHSEGQVRVSASWAIPSPSAVAFPVHIWQVAQNPDAGSFQARPKLWGAFAFCCLDIDKHAKPQRWVPS